MHLPALQAVLAAFGQEAADALQEDAVALQAEAEAQQGFVQEAGQALAALLGQQDFFAEAEHEDAAAEQDDAAAEQVAGAALAPQPSEPQLAVASMGKTSAKPNTAKDIQTFAILILDLL